VIIQLQENLIVITAMDATKRFLVSVLIERENDSMIMQVNFFAKLFIMI